jgi:hypothetical protein
MRRGKRSKRQKKYKMKEIHEHLLQQASSEIKALRRQNELMSARLEVFDSMMRLFHTSPNYGQGGMMHPDIVYEIDKYLESYKATE